ncbi:MAG TPA: response regulator, partial [Ohtaekwangia sp.]|nr:response regulator [Ohtaekwangia sp.]
MVYLADDDEDDIEIVQEALAHNSYKGPVISSDNGLKLIEQLNSANNSNKPAVIILDLNMPRLDGFQTLAQLRKHPVYAHIPVVVLTASSSKHDEIRCYELGCNFYMSKPVKLADYAGLAA